MFVDCTEGVSGDMLLSAMIHALPRDRRESAISRLTKAAGMSGLTIHVVEVKDLDEAGLGISYTRAEDQDHEVSYDEAFATLGRFSEHLGSASKLPGRILGLIFDAEAQAHNRPAERVHLHEIGRPHALFNMAAVGLLHSELESLGAGEFVASTIVTGKGIIVVSHGAVRVPAPASKILLKGLKSVPGDDPGERATPSGVACVKALVSRQSDEPPTVYRSKGVGFGTKRFGGRLGRTTLLWA